MSDEPRFNVRREAIVAIVTFALSLVVLPLVVAAIAYQSGQAIFSPALKSLYTYFFKYTLLAALAVTFLVTVTRLVIKALRRSG